MHSTSLHFQELIKKIKSNHFCIPEFQRPFVWKDFETRRLIDSIARNYPIGSLLILEVGKEKDKQFASRAIEACVLKDDEQDIDDSVESNDDVLPQIENGSYYVLDGQQRLTSIARVFSNGYEKKVYFFDLKKMFEVFFDQNDSFEYDWIYSVNRTKEFSQIRKDDNRSIRADVALEPINCSKYLSEYFEDSVDFIDYTKEQKRNIIGKLSVVFETIRNFSVPFICLKSDTHLETICRVFETINSTGVKLSTFDLAVARYHPKLKIRKMFENSKLEDSNLRNYEVEGESILKVLALCSLREKNRDKIPEVTRSVLLSLNENFILENWDLSIKCFSDAIRMTKSWGIEEAHRSFLIPISATLLSFNKKNINEELFKNWYFYSALIKDNIKSNNYRLGADYKFLCDSVQKLIEGQILSKVFQYKISITATDLVDSTSNSILFKTVIYLLKHDYIKNDFFDDSSILGNVDVDYTLLNIFPNAKKHKFDNRKIDSLANKLIVNIKSYKEYNNSLPEIYLQDYIKKYRDKSRIDKKIKINDLPINVYDSLSFNLLKKENYEKFLLNRANKIIERLKILFNDIWEK
ncbi:DUF262 domain-containing protein [Pigmentibacter sp. JX0631]|uniref:DUF262 domain-containing protein n=1 Tax=Pigmentibacter sp. JX0631 TaxID=2976982 RepID=UPI002468730F|nr:DUF262 domain-containing protein [Pigmentibacter sp. JX0631]WGL60286.1 DUF262 domain-containing protein [Pigmentibacter sp. JX0631]